MTTDPSRSHIANVLVTDDEASMRMIVRRMLESRGYKVWQASHGDEALALLNAGEFRPLDLLITDVNMPECSGVDLARSIRAVLPDLKIIFTSGRRQPELISQIASDANTKFLEKPFSGAELISCVSDVLAK